MQGSKPLLEGRNVVKKYNADDESKETVIALDNVSFDINENEFVVIVGPSGCGKTTLLRICSGLTKADGGEVLLRGDPITGPSMERAMVFQHFNLFPWRTTRDNVGFGLEMEGLPKQERKEIVDKYIELVGLKGFENSYPNELSGGMQQRVGLARALAVDPEILLMDEPFGALDSQTRKMMQEELLEIWDADRKTILFVTHDIDEAILLGDRVIVMGVNPREIRGEFDIPFDRPRYDRDIETTTDFIETKKRIKEALEAPGPDDQ